jgi:hypothetical protein
MAPYRRWLDHLLYEAYAQAVQENDARRQLHASLALVPVDSSQVEYIYGRLLKGQPQEVIVIREALSDHKSEGTASGMNTDRIVPSVVAPGRTTKLPCRRGRRSARSRTGDSLHALTEHDSSNP